MTRSLTAKWCPEPHVAPITAVSSDPASGLVATADAAGIIAVGNGSVVDTPLLLSHGARVDRALAISPGGALLAVGDDTGRVAVWRVTDGALIFEERREDAGFAMRALAFTPDGERLAALGTDGAIRLVHVATGERIGKVQGCGGLSLDWDNLGKRIVAISESRQPTLVDLVARQRVMLPPIPGGALVARFTQGGDQVVVLGGEGLHLVDVDRREIVAQQTADRSSGMLDVVLSPDGDRIAVITAQSVHAFAVDRLRHVESRRHGAPAATGVATWDMRGVAVASADGRLYRPDVEPSLPSSVCVAGNGAFRVVAHDHKLAVWQERNRRRVFVPEIEEPEGERRREPLPVGQPITEIAVDREGKLLAVLPQDRPVHVYEADTGRLRFQAGADTVDTRRMALGVGVVGCLLEPAGLRWFELRKNRVFELAWPQDFDITGGGTWLAAVTPSGHVLVLDPATAEAVLPPLAPPADAPVRTIAFVARRPELLMLDADDVLSLVDLTSAARDGGAPVYHRITAFHDVLVDRLWGLEDGRHAVARIQEPEGTATLVFLDLDNGEPVHVASGLLPYVTVDPATGALLEPAAGSALLERGPTGEERMVLRSLPAGEWLTYGFDGTLAASGGARRALQAAPTTW